MNDSTEPALVRRTCITVDLENYSRLDMPTQESAQRGLAEALAAAAAQVGLRRLDWQVQDGGDGELAVLPLGESEPIVVGAFPLALNEHFRMLHERDALRLRARMAINHGMVAQGAMGFAGWGPVDVTRIADAPAVRAALRDIDEARVVLALSAALYRDIVQQGHAVVRPEQFREIRVPRIDATAWVMVPGVDASRIPVNAPDEEPEEHAGAVHQQVNATHSAIAQSGRDTVGNAVGPNSNVTNVSGSNNTVNKADFHSPVHTNTVHFGPRHG
jgi:hypothetical protein